MKRTVMVFTGVAAIIVIGTIGFSFRPACLPLLVHQMVLSPSAFFGKDRC